eukprot:scaffold198991_cov36-Tisochrysis_lutea.AAC.2
MEVVRKYNEYYDEGYFVLVPSAFNIQYYLSRLVKLCFLMAIVFKVLARHHFVEGFPIVAHVSSGASGHPIEQGMRRES